MSTATQTTEEQTVDVDSVINSVVEQQEVLPDAHLTHFGLSMLVDIPLLHYRDHSRFVPVR